MLKIQWLISLESMLPVIQTAKIAFETSLVHASPMCLLPGAVAPLSPTLRKPCAQIEQLFLLNDWSGGHSRWWRAQHVIETVYRIPVLLNKLHPFPHSRPQMKIFQSSLGSSENLSSSSNWYRPSSLWIRRRWKFLLTCRFMSWNPKNS